MSITASGAEVTVIINNLKDLVTNNPDIDDYCKDLYSSLQSFKVVIDEQAEWRNNEPDLELMVWETMKLAREAEDAIGTFLVEECTQRAKDSFSKLFNKYEHKPKLHILLGKIEEIREKVNQFQQQYKMAWVERPKSVETTSTSTKLHMSVDDDIMIGREVKQEAIMRCLLNGSEELEVISITGIQGIGKTTLATAVFRRPEIEYHFHVLAFASVSKIYDRKKVILGILRAVDSVTDEMTMMSVTELAEVIRKLLTGRRFLIVLDDVGETKALDDFRSVLPWGDQRGSRVLITTEYHDVATKASKTESIHNLDLLPEYESRTLLRLSVFGKNQCPGELEDLEVEILNKCNGLPLSITVVAGVLSRNREEMHWWRSVVQGLIGDEIVSPMNNLISISFDQLPQRLKSCFLYLGVFKEDFEIPTRTILQLWIAEGLVQEDRVMCLEDVAAGYLQELVDRSLVMVERWRSDGRVKTCRIHDALRLFCKEEARKENFFREFTEFSSSDDSPRIIINSNVPEFLAALKPHANHVRSLLSFAKDGVVCPSEYLSSIPKAFKLLRVLDARSIRLTRFPGEMCFLYLLRYIAISSDLRTLPEKLSVLCNLQTLIVLTTQRILDIRADISKMSMLRHLYSNASINLRTIKEGLSGNENLQTLSTISLESYGNENFQISPNLRKLGIRGNMSTILDGNFFGRLSRLDHLENLKLINDDQSCKLQGLPHEIHFPRNLTSLTLRGTLLGWEHMSKLGKLRLLKVLKLKDKAFEGDIWETEGGGFESLEVLHIDTTNLLNWKASEEHFPKLVSLSLKHCNKLRDFPDGVADMPTLRIIDVYCCNRYLAYSARRIAILKHELGDERFKLLVYPPDQ